MLILHGAGSRKENHADFAALCAAEGWLALAYDQRGHGEADDEMSPAVVRDVGEMARMLAARDDVDASRVCVRGSSMGGFVAIHAAASQPRIAGAIAICPAWEEHLRAGIEGPDRLDMRISERGRRDLSAWLTEHHLPEAVRRLAPRPLVLLHARGDERIDWRSTQRLYEAAGDPRRLVVEPGGDHRSAQHDAELQRRALGWLSEQLG